ncbi:MAG: peptidoglycan DD-metalloendopeptidase family protein [Anaerolineales bacterium]|nr:peptidoglycan DD-metalloendopeptidase family protein [Anaerolineales bacterium]
MTLVERGEDEETYEYDANGNMIGWTEGEEEWELVYNAENRLSSLSDGTDTWSFTYDGDGRRVRQVGPMGEVTHYVGGAYEVRDAAGDAEVLKYYGIAGQRVAMGDSEGIKYLLTDHLGSVSAVLDDTGAMLSQQRYTPYGVPRFEVGITETDFGYTGQRMLTGTGLMDYNARFYAPGLGRWTQPDSIVPSIGDPQNLNRFTYVLNSPLNFIDPSGRCASGIILDSQCLAFHAPGLRYRPENQGACAGQICPPARTDTMSPPLDIPLVVGGNDWLTKRTNTDPGHIGVDYSGTPGIPVRSLGNGIVATSSGCTYYMEYNCDYYHIELEKRITTQSNQGYGHVVVIEYPYGSLNPTVITALDIQPGYSLYALSAHLLDAPVVNSGDPVEVGEVIGLLGSSGYSSGPHLHFELRQGPTGYVKSLDFYGYLWFGLPPINPHLLEPLYGINLGKGIGQ